MNHRAEPRPASGAVLIVTQHPVFHHIVLGRNVLELLSQGFDVDVICSDSDEGTHLLTHRPGLRVYTVPVQHRRKHAIRYALEYAAFFIAAFVLVSVLAMRKRYEVVQVDNLPDFLAMTTVVPRLRGTRIVFNMFELTPEMIAARFTAARGRWFIRIARWLEAAATGWADHVIVVSEECRKRVITRGVRPAKISVVLNTTPWWPAVSEKPTGDREGGDSSFIVTHSTLVPRYGVDLAIRAFAQLAAARPRLSLRIIGDGEHRPALERLAQDLGVADRVTFTGLLPWAETIAQVRQAAVGIVAVLADGYGEVLLPTKLLEYARFGVPAVCSRLAAVQAYFPEDAVAYFVPGDADQLAARVDELLRDAAAAAHQGAQAQEVARSLAWEQVRHSYFEALGLTGHVKTSAEASLA